MCLKLGEHLNIQINYKIFTVRVVLNTLIFRIFSFLSREAIFLAIFMKSIIDPLGVKEQLFQFGFFKHW